MTLETHVYVKHVDLDVDHYNERAYAFNPFVGQWTIHKV